MHAAHWELRTLQRHGDGVVDDSKMCFSSTCEAARPVTPTLETLETTDVRLRAAEAKVFLSTFSATNLDVDVVDSALGLGKDTSERTKTLQGLLDAVMKERKKLQDELGTMRSAHKAELAEAAQKYEATLEEARITTEKVTATRDARLREAEDEAAALRAELRRAEEEKRRMAADGVARDLILESQCVKMKEGHDAAEVALRRDNEKLESNLKKQKAMAASLAQTNANIIEDLERNLQASKIAARRFEARFEETSTALEKLKKVMEAKDVEVEHAQQQNAAAKKRERTLRALVALVKLRGEGLIAEKESIAAAHRVEIEIAVAKAVSEAEEKAKAATAAVMEKATAAAEKTASSASSDTTAATQKETADASTLTEQWRFDVRLGEEQAEVARLNDVRDGLEKDLELSRRRVGELEAELDAKRKKKPPPPAGLLPTDEAPAAVAAPQEKEPKKEPEAPPQAPSQALAQVPSQALAQPQPQPQPQAQAQAQAQVQLRPILSARNDPALEGLETLVATAAQILTKLSDFARSGVHARQELTRLQNQHYYGPPPQNWVPLPPRADWNA